MRTNMKEYLKRRCDYDPNKSEGEEKTIFITLASAVTELACLENVHVT